MMHVLFKSASFMTESIELISELTNSSGQLGSTLLCTRQAKPELDNNERILVVSGVESAEPDLKSSEVRVKGVFEPPKLVEYVYKRTGKHATIVKQEPEKKEEEKPKDAKEEKKAEEGGGDKKGEGESKEKKEGDAAEAKGEATEENKVVEMRKNEYYYYPPQFYSAPRYVPMDLYAPPPPPPYNYYQPSAAAPYNPYPPQIFSDENPNACSVM